MVPQDQLLLMLLEVIDGIDVGWANSKHRMWACIVADLVCLAFIGTSFFRQRAEPALLVTHYWVSSLAPGEVEAGLLRAGPLKSLIRGKAISPTAGESKSQGQISTCMVHMTPGGKNC